VLVITDVGPASCLTQGLAFSTSQIEEAPPPFHYAAVAPGVAKGEGLSSARTIRLTTDDSNSKMRKRDPWADAARWFVALLDTVDINQLWPKFEDWLHKDPINREAYEEIERVWYKLCSVGAVLERTGLSCDSTVVLH